MIKECPDWRTGSNSVPDLTKFLAVLRQTCVSSFQNEQLRNPSSQREYDVTSFLDSPLHEGDLGMLGTIRIQKELGCGGMGIVFKGLDQELGRTVAVKIFVEPQ